MEPSAPAVPAPHPAIFVSIAAYRDPQLVPTIHDCLAAARHPERLRFCICWQRGEDERLPGWVSGRQFNVIEVPFQESRGVCWARSVIMDLWDCEEWYLQLDSHHRFAPDWDVRLLQHASAVGGPRTVLSAFPPAFTLAGNRSSTPLLTAHDRFDEDGIPLPAGILFPQWRPGLPPRRTRYLSAAFLFAPGSFVEDVPYDPELYFHGEETMLTVRAFTAGYDLYQPCDILLWHEYTRAYRRKHWEDHVPGSTVDLPWYERDALSRARIRQLLAERRPSRHGLGNRRSLADYERYAGISFQTRRIQEYTRRHQEPPNPPCARDWAEAESD